MKAAKHNIDSSLDHKYQIQLQQKTDTLRNVVETEIKEFAKYTPNIKNDQNSTNLSEMTPLLGTLSSSPSPASLYGVIREHEMLITNVQTNVLPLSAEDSIINQRMQRRRDRRNMIIGLILALLTLAILVTFIYFRFIY